MKRLFKILSSLIIVAVMLMTLSTVFSQTSSTFLSVKLSDYKVYIDKIQIPVYSINNNLMVNVQHLDYYSYNTSVNENGVIIYRNPSKIVKGLPANKWNSKYSKVTIKPKNWCILNQKNIPVLYLDNQPFIFLNDLYADNIVKINGKRVDITLGIIDGIKENMKYSEQIKFKLKVLNNDINVVNYTIGYVIYDYKLKESLFLTETNIYDMFKKITENQYTLLEYYVLDCEYYLDGSIDKDLYIYDDSIKNLKYYNTSEYINKIKFINSLYQKANNNNPIYIVESQIKSNSIGLPEAKISIYNFSSNPVDAIEISFLCWSLFNQPALNSENTNQFIGISQNICIPAYGDSTETWNISKYTNVGKINNVIVRKLHFINGQIWINPSISSNKKL
ncbi:hypothetical protein ACAG39_10335 [Caldicellulosiruptoraceae bacterium PP1]